MTDNAAFAAQVRRIVAAEQRVARRRTAILVHRLRAPAPPARSISVRFPKEMAERLALMAKSHYRSVNGEVLLAVAKAVAKWEHSS